MSNANVAIRNVSKSFGKTRVLDDVSLDIEAGSFTTLLGPSGCGKTTLLRSIAGFYDVERGEILIGERKVNDVPSHLRNAIMVFQDYALFPHMTIRENITYGLRIHKVPKEVIEERLAKTVGYLDIGSLLDRTPGQISGGQQQRVALARALIMEPEVLLLDEPLSNLDAKLRVTIRAELRQLQRRLGITTIYVTHDQAEALAMSDKIAIMRDGRVMQVGSPTEVYYRPDNAFVASFVGTVNFIKGKVSAIEEEETVVEAAGLSLRVRVAAPKTGSPSRSSIGEEVTISVRPETIKILDDGEAAGQNSFEGEIRSCVFEGSSVRYWIGALGAELVVDAFDPGERSIREGKVLLRVDPARMHLIAKERALA